MKKLPVPNLPKLVSSARSSPFAAVRDPTRDVIPMAMMETVSIALKILPFIELRASLKISRLISLRLNC
jgi:hypothetical protein